MVATTQISSEVVLALYDKIKDQVPKNKRLRLEKIAALAMLSLQYAEDGHSSGVVNISSDDMDLFETPEHNPQQLNEG